MIVKEVMTCDVSPVTMFSSTVVAACEDGRFINPIEILNCQKVLKKLCRIIGLGKCENAFALFYICANFLLLV